MSKKKDKKPKRKIDSFETLEAFVKAVRKKYGKKADKMRVEVQRPFTLDNETYYSPHELSHLGVATYPGDKISGDPKETVVIFR